MTPTALLSTLRWQLILAVCLMALGAAALVAANANLTQAATELRDAENAQRRAAVRLAAARDEEDAVRAAIDEYGQLRSNRLIGPEQRLNWVERLDASRRALRIDTIRYEILPQRRLNEAFNGQLNWMESRMRLDMEVPHSQALIDLIASLTGTPSAVVQPLSCEIERGAATTAVLKARCELRWLTLLLNAPEPAP